MSDDNNELLELHKKIEKLDEERDALKEKLATQSAPWYKNPALVAALAGMLAGLGTTTENLWNRYQERVEKQAQEQTVEQKETSKKKTHGYVYRYMAKRQDEVEDACAAYAYAVMQTMPKPQKTRAERLLRDLGVDADGPTAILRKTRESMPEVAVEEAFEEIQKKIEAGEAPDFAEMDALLR